MFNILGARLVANEQVRIASTKIGGIGPKEAAQVRYRLGISYKIKVNESTKYQIDQIERIIGQDHVVRWDLRIKIRADIKRLITISCYRGIRHKDRLPLRGQRTHTNARTSRKLRIPPTRTQIKIERKKRVKKEKSKNERKKENERGSPPPQGVVASSLKVGKR